MQAVRLITALVLVASACANGESSTPAADGAVRSVPLEEIHFDTFDGGSVSLADATPELIARLLDKIPPIDEPTYEPVGDARWLSRDDVILGFVDRSGHAWAYPVKIMNFHEIVSDTLDGQPILITYCPLCGSGIVFDRTVLSVTGESEVLKFSNTSALYQNDMVMVDRSSGSYWWQVTGSAIVGSRTGDQLTVLPAQMSLWGDWLDAHANGQVLQRPTALDYSRDPFVGYAETITERGTPFPVSPPVLEDARLDPGSIVVAIDSTTGVVAWPVMPPRTIQVDIDEGRLEIVTTSVGATMTDLATGASVPSRTTLWFALVAAFPDLVLGAD